MIDDDSNPRPSGLVGPDGRVPKSMRNVKAQREADGHKPVTEARVAELVTAGSIAGMRQVYEALAIGNEENFAKMEQVIVDRVLGEIERRSLRGKIKALWLRWRGKEVTLS